MTAYEYTLVKTNPPPLPQSDGPGLGASTTRDRHHPWGRCYLDGAALPLPGQVEGIGLAPGALEGGGRLPPPPLPGRPATVPQQVCQHPPLPQSDGPRQGAPPPGTATPWGRCYLDVGQTKWKKKWLPATVSSRAHGGLT
jgi:hypothetical protein